MIGKPKDMLEVDSERKTERPLSSRHKKCPKQKIEISLFNGDSRYKGLNTRDRIMIKEAIAETKLESSPRKEILVEEEEVVVNDRSVPNEMKLLCVVAPYVEEDSPDTPRLNVTSSHLDCGVKFLNH